ncbi:hypothetical protein EVAR_27774_1 [Eumeta japonica]|uniref:Uncharacterized protein n=1 Tax=Eumeta variegata TaxID=151549 RepID=A0A4C1VB29_EUMVA|nr:hypothetical protein EVAR_27774_1 [Eumeta japonica]
MQQRAGQQSKSKARLEPEMKTRPGYEKIETGTEIRNRIAFEITIERCSSFRKMKESIRCPPGESSGRMKRGSGAGGGARCYYPGGRPANKSSAASLRLCSNLHYADVSRCRRRRL